MPVLLSCAGSAEASSVIFKNQNKETLELVASRARLGDHLCRVQFPDEMV